MYTDDEDLVNLKKLRDRLGDDYDNAENADEDYYPIWLEWKAVYHAILDIEQIKKAQP